ncbi:MAG: hypothetical protein F6K36_13290 [Symploca sp. SIO3C6]|nr:hypothetical protein [Symploca sp. SIO3C6]
MMNNNQQEQLFTELTSEEGAKVSGGAWVTKLELKHFVVNDTQEWPRDEIYLKLDGKKVYSKGGVSSGDTLYINKTFTMTGSYDTLKLFENDTWPNGDEHLGTKNVFTSQIGNDQKASFTRKGADYDLYFDVYRAWV